MKDVVIKIDTGVLWIPPHTKGKISSRFRDDNWVIYNMAAYHWRDGNTVTGETVSMFLVGFDVDVSHLPSTIKWFKREYPNSSGYVLIIDDKEVEKIKIRR